MVTTSRAMTVFDIFEFGSLCKNKPAGTGCNLQYDSASVYMYIYIYIYIYICKYARMSVYVCAYVSVCVSIYKKYVSEVYWGELAHVQTCACVVGQLYSEKLKLPIIGLVSAYTGRALFAVTITYLWRYHYWTEAGLPKVVDYIFISGTLAALIGAVAVTLGFNFGTVIKKLSWAKLHPRFISLGLVTATFGIWVVQQII